MHFLICESVHVACIDLCLISRGNVKVSTSTHTRVRSLHSYNFIINTVWWSSILYLSRSLPLSNTIHLVVLSFNYG